MDAPSTGVLIGYARVSRPEQDPAAQEAELTAAGAVRVFTDHGESSRKADRSQWLACRDYLRPGDTLLVRRLDRLAGTERMAIEIIRDLADQGIHLRSLTEPEIDTTSPMGRALLGFIGILAQLRVDTIRENTRRGLAHARAQGRIGGRPTVVTPERLDAALRLRAAGQSHTQIARALGVSRSAINRASTARRRLATTPCCASRACQSMDTRRLAFTGCAALLILTGCSTGAKPQPSPTTTPPATSAPTEAPTTDSPSAAPTAGQTWDVAPSGATPDGPGDLGPDAAQPQDAETAKTAATDVITALLAKERAPDQWWAELSVRLTPTAQETWRWTEPRRLPDAQLTEPAEVDTISATDAEVLVPTTIGAYRVTLARDAADGAWLASAIEPPAEGGAQ